jgi:hypothetical protein
MAYFTQDMKKDLSPKVMAVCKKFKVKATLSVDNHSSFVLNVKSSKIDFIGNFNTRLKESHSRRDSPAKDYLQVNPYSLSDCFSGDALAFLQQVHREMSMGNWNNSRAEIDYFDVGWYTSIKIGKYNKPFVLEA